MNGYIASITDGKSGEQYGVIKCEEYSDNLRFRIPDTQVGLLKQGDKVTFEMRIKKKDPSKVSVFKVRLINDGTAAMPGERTNRQTNPVAVQESTNRQTKTVAVQGSANRQTSALDKEYYLPIDTAELLFGAAGVTIENAGLRAQKYIRKYNDKKENLKILHALEYSPKEKELLQKLVNSQRYITTYFKFGYKAKGALGARLVIGLGGSSVFETSITLHPIYGFPYIPGSSLKGCLRSFIIKEVFSSDEDTALLSKEFVTIFGDQTERGGVFFMDVYPTSIQKLELDILNPHYSAYYQGKSAPTDDMEPGPIKFYSVPERTAFTIGLCSNKVDIKSAVINGESLIELFTAALQDIGFGAKTAVGYGWFSNIKWE